MSFLSDLLARIRGGSAPAPQPQAQPSLSFGSTDSTRMIVPPARPLPVAPAPIMSAKPKTPAPPAKPGFIKSLVKSVAPDTYANLRTIDKDKSNAKAAVAAAKLLVNVPKEVIVQPAARLVTQLGQQVATGGNAQNYTPGNFITQNLLGKETIKPIDRELGEDVATAHEYVKNNNPAVKAGANPNDLSSKFISGVSTPFAALAIGGMKALDIEPGGSGGKKVVKEGAEKLVKDAVEKIGKDAAEQVLKDTTEQALKQVPDQFLSPALSKAAPRYNYGVKAFTPAFQSDLDKAAYIAAQSKPSARDADFVREAMEASGLSEAQLRAHGAEVKASIKGLAKDAEPGELVVPRMTPKAAPKNQSLISDLAAKAEVPNAQTPGAALQSRELPTQAIPEPSSPNAASVANEGIPGSQPLPPASSQNPGPLSGGESLSYTDNVPQNSSMHQRIEGSPLAPEQKAAAHEFVTSVENGAKAVEAKGKPITFKEVQQAAEKSQNVIAGVVNRDQSLARQVELLNTTAADLEKFKNGKYDVEATELLLRRQTVLTDTARLLNSAKIQPTEKNALAELIKSMADEKKTVDDLLKKARDPRYLDLQSADPIKRQAAQLRFYEDNLNTGVGKWVDLVRYNSMLSSPVTQSRSLLGNLAGMVYSPLTKVVAGTTDAVRDAIFGGGRKQFAGEGLSFLKGAIADPAAYKQAWSNLADTMIPSRNFEKKILEGEALPLTKGGTLARGVENTLSLPMRLLDGVDRFVATLNASGEENALLSRLAKGGKLDTPGATIADEAQKAAYYWAGRGKNLPKGQGSMLNFIDHATGPIRAWKNSPSPTVRLIGDMAVPFLNIATNEFKKAVEFSPLGFGTLRGAANKEAQFAKAAIGTATIVGLSTAIASDKITGGAPRTKAERDAWEAAGIQPYSVKIGGRWVSYQQLPSQVSYSLAFLANAKQVREEGLLTEDGFKNLLTAGAKQMSFLSDQSFMEGVGRFFDAFNSDDPEKYGKLAASYTQQFIPYRAFNAWLTRVTDQYVREPNTDENFFKKQWDFIQKQTPILNKNVPIKKDATTGEPVKRPTWVDDPAQRVGESLLPAPMSVEDPVKAQQIRDAAAAKKKYEDLNKADQVASEARKQRALQTYQELTQLEPNHAGNKLKQIFDTDKELYDQVMSVANNVNAKADADTAELRKLDVNTGNRARAIVNNLRALDSDQEKAAYMQKLYEAKPPIITKAINDQVTYLIQQSKEKATP